MPPRYGQSQSDAPRPQAGRAVTAAQTYTRTRLQMQSALLGIPSGDRGATSRPAGAARRWPCPCAVSVHSLHASHTEHVPLLPALLLPRWRWPLLVDCCCWPGRLWEIASCCCWPERLWEIASCCWWPGCLWEIAEGSELPSYSM